MPTDFKPKILHSITFDQKQVMRHATGKEKTEGPYELHRPVNYRNGYGSPELCRPRTDKRIVVLAIVFQMPAN